MTGKLGTLVKTTLAVVSTVALVSLAPPLTSNFSKTVSVPEGMEEMAHEDGRFGFCADNLSGIDCACFAKTAGQVLDNQRPRALGWSYADPWKLAELQAKDSCAS